ncbi:MAG: OmpA family protein [Rhizobiaceae bacterium]
MLEKKQKKAAAKEKKLQEQKVAEERKRLDEQAAKKKRQEERRAQKALEEKRAKNALEEKRAQKALAEKRARKKQRKQQQAAEEKRRIEAAAAEEKKRLEDQALAEKKRTEAATAEERRRLKKAERKEKRAQKKKLKEEKPENIVVEPGEKQVKRAEKEKTKVVPDNISRKDREKLKKAERKRRENARRDRAELLGAAAVGAIVGAIIPQLGGTVAADEGDRIVVKRNGRLVVRKDESALFRDRGSDIRYERMRGGLSREIVTRPNGVRIVSVRDAGGNVLRREKILTNGRRIVMFDSYHGGERRHAPIELIPNYRVNIPQDRYVVSAGGADREFVRDTFLAEPVYQAPQRYSLREIQENEPVRALVRRVDLDTVTFESGSSFVSISQVELLGDMAGGMLDVIDEQPDAVFLIEGHTDAIGSEISNLTLSDRRAESVARILIDAYGVPPENLVTQGYGEEYLKIPTQASEWQNRRVTVRNITPILSASGQ